MNAIIVVPIVNHVIIHLFVKNVLKIWWSITTVNAIAHMKMGITLIILILAKSVKLIIAHIVKAIHANNV